MFDLPDCFADDDSVVYRFGELLFNLLNTTVVAESSAPSALLPDAGPRCQLTLEVDDGDGMCEESIARGWTCATAHGTGLGEFGPPGFRHRAAILGGPGREEQGDTRRPFCIP